MPQNLCPVCGGGFGAYTAPEARCKCPQEGELDQKRAKQIRAKLSVMVDDLNAINAENGPSTSEDAWMRTIIMMLEDVMEWPDFNPQSKEE